MTKIETGIRLNGAVAGQNADGNVTYFTTDLLGSIRTTTNNDGFNTITYTYDAFGSLVEGDLTGETDYGYLGKQFDSQTGLYNYGYRDYAPIVARFTTVDPICDGNNWFVYVNNDPVNFVDLWGLEASDEGTDSNKEANPQENKKGYSKLKNTLIGVGEVLLGVGVYVATTIAAGGIEVATEGVGTYYAGMAIVEGYATGALFVASGITRLAGVNNQKVSDDITNAVVPSEVDIANSIRDSLRNEK